MLGGAHPMIRYGWVLLFAAVLAGQTVCFAEAAPAKVAVPEQKSEVQRFTVTPEALLMWSSDGPVRDVYVTMSRDPFDEVSLTDNPVLLFSNKEQDYGMQPGGRLTFQYMIDDDRKWGLEASGFALAEEEDDWSVGVRGGERGLGIALYINSPDDPTGYEYRFIAYYPGRVSSGAIAINSESQLWGAHVQGLYNIKQGERLNLGATFGFQYLDLDEGFSIRCREGEATDSEWAWTRDTWRTHNRFYGARLGAKVSGALDRFEYGLEAGVCLGATEQDIHINGSSAASWLLGGQTLPVGLFSAETNLGRYSDTRFGVVPFANLNVGVRINKRLSFRVGYNVMYWDSVARPGSQVNRKVNWYINGGICVYRPGSVPPYDPVRRHETDDYMVHGLNAGFTIRF